MNAAHLEVCASPEWRKKVNETILPEALKEVVLGRDVLEIGPGPGFTTDVLRTLTEQLTAVEVDESLAAQLSARMEGSNVVVVRGDATSLDFTDDRFSAAASFHMLHHIEPADAQDRVFAELARVLEPGGVLVAADSVWKKESSDFHQGDTYLPIAPEDLKERLANAGFVAIEVRTYEPGWVCTAKAQ
ncbi:MAG: class I SAM-dependent methyltransferase [Acidimicrobiales bacterium]